MQHCLPHICIFSAIALRPLRPKTSNTLIGTYFFRIIYIYTQRFRNIIGINVTI